MVNGGDLIHREQLKVRVLPALPIAGVMLMGA